MRSSSTYNWFSQEKKSYFTYNRTSTYNRNLRVFIYSFLKNQYSLESFCTMYTDIAIQFCNFWNHIFQTLGPVLKNVVLKLQNRVAMYPHIDGTLCTYNWLKYTKINSESTSLTTLQLKKELANTIGAPWIWVIKIAQPFGITLGPFHIVISYCIYCSTILWWCNNLTKIIK